MKPLDIITGLTRLRRQVQLSKDLDKAKEWILLDIDGYIQRLRENYLNEVKAFNKLQSDIYDWNRGKK